MVLIRFIAIFNQVLVLFLLVLLGFSFRKLEIVKPSIDQNLSGLVLNLTLPALIITSMNYEFSSERLANLSSVFFITLAVYLLMISVSYLIRFILPSTEKEKDIYQFMIIFANTAFVGYPVIDLIFGAEGIFLAAIYNAIFNLMIWTIGVFIINPRTSKQEFSAKQLLTPGIVAVMIGMLLFLFSIDLPGPILTTLEKVGGTTTPLALFVVGSILAQIELSRIFTNFKLWLITLLRLIVLPFFVLALLRSLPVNDLVLGVTVILTGMPVAVTAVIFAQEFGGDYELASEGIFLTTLLSGLTIPLMIYLL
ncbi:AEC family transporter [Natroniella sulfidigena]|uniref:AEC family transporter n=1 Tax=Natroniella sulfidigena TaxID=723921 RepID=UPI00200B6616|nr:AEC family transporter [Natroniella sulfidigena]